MKFFFQVIHFFNMSTNTSLFYFFTKLLLSLAMNSCLCCSDGRKIIFVLSTGKIIMKIIFYVIFWWLKLMSFSPGIYQKLLSRDTSFSLFSWLICQMPHEIVYLCFFFIFMITTYSYWQLYSVVLYIGANNQKNYYSLLLFSSMKHTQKFFILFSSPQFDFYFCRCRHLLLFFLLFYFLLLTTRRKWIFLLFIYFSSMTFSVRFQIMDDWLTIIKTSNYSLDFIQKNFKILRIFFLCRKLFLFKLFSWLFPKIRTHATEYVKCLYRTEESKCEAAYREHTKRDRKWIEQEFRTYQLIHFRHFTSALRLRIYEGEKFRFPCLRCTLHSKIIVSSRNLLITVRGKIFVQL